MKIKVNKAKLIAAISAKAKLKEAEYAKALDKWETDCKAAAKGRVVLYTEKIAEIKAGKFDANYGPRRVEEGYWPTKPNKPQAHEEALVDRLNLVEGEVMDIDDRSDYFNYI